MTLSNCSHLRAVSALKASSSRTTPFDSRVWLISCVVQDSPAEIIRPLRFPVSRRLTSTLLPIPYPRYLSKNLRRQSHPSEQLRGIPFPPGPFLTLPLGPRLNHTNHHLLLSTNPDRHQVKLLGAMETWELRRLRRRAQSNLLHRLWKTGCSWTPQSPKAKKPPRHPTER